MLRALPLALSLLCACGEADPAGWSPEEIGNAEYVFAALQADGRAAEIENLGEAGFDDFALGLEEGLGRIALPGIGCSRVGQAVGFVDDGSVLGAGGLQHASGEAAGPVHGVLAVE